MPSLLKSLEDLGDQIVAADLPVDVRKVLGGLVRYVETGSLEPPAAPLGREETQALSEADAEVARLRDQVAELQAQAQPAAAAPLPEASSPASVLPPPVNDEAPADPEPPAPA